jgi:hypothetical protein
MPMQRSHHADPSEHRRSVMLGDQCQRFHRVPAENHPLLTSAAKANTANKATVAKISGI